MQRRITRCFKSLFFQRVLSALLMLVIWQGLFCVDSFGETDAPSTALAPVDHGGDFIG
jgi:hypothetical protein